MKSDGVIMMITGIIWLVTLFTNCVAFNVAEIGWLLIGTSAFITGYGAVIAIKGK